MKWSRFMCCCLVVGLTVSALSQSAVLPDDHAAKVRLAVQRLGTGEHSKVKVTLRDKAGVKGYISQIGSESFQVTHIKSGRVTTIAYQEVQEVRRLGLSTAAKIGIAAGVGVGVVVAATLGALAASGE
jgi:hypothetical protein